MPVELVVDTPPALAAALAARLADAIPQGLAKRGRFTLALPGGSVAEAFFPVLRDAPLPWARCDFFWTDERAVPPGHVESNYRLATELWLAPAGVPEARVHRMRGEASDLDAAARAHARELDGVVAEADPYAVPRLDLVLTGVGPDGHVASLFPDHPLLAEERRRVAALRDSPKPPPGRLTLTLPVLAAAELVVVAAFGPGKATAMRAALGGGGGVAGSALPVAQLVHRAARVLVLLDPAAAGVAAG